jgi:hypothetical protein
VGWLWRGEQHINLKLATTMRTKFVGWIEEAVKKQIGRNRLDDWMDRIARYWSVQIDQIDEDQLYEVLKSRRYCQVAMKRLAELEKQKVA